MSTTVGGAGSGADSRGEKSEKRRPGHKPLPVAMAWPAIAAAASFTASPRDHWPQTSPHLFLYPNTFV
ncbi:hypothetical protein C2845_PM05G34930 [Panicum miliaceum]|uniref:Uncharacterized protein n=1 Tax=Panicum miliaceum TaxID=4540 RepID=A0A3L6SVP7_PANMI|nr:hypothetical protein C2845_PM05G34930 [Panicum miliaceum]